MAGVHLDIAHIWQLDPDSQIPVEKRRSICAPVVVNIVLEYINKNSAHGTIGVSEIIEHMEQHGGRVEGMGWKHSAGVATLVDFGLIAWRRNWHAPSQDPQFFIDHEDYSSEQVAAFMKQLNEEEQAGTSLKARALHSIITSLVAGVPVIASVLAGFSENEAFHQVVISGYKEDGDKFQLEIIDPLLRSSEQRNIELEYFWKYFKMQAIFIAPKA